jgi:hypothetical protein
MIERKSLFGLCPDPTRTRFKARSSWISTAAMVKGTYLKSQTVDRLCEVSTATCIGFAALLTLEVDNIENTIGGGEMSFRATLLASVVSVFSLYFVNRELQLGKQSQKLKYLFFVLASLSFGFLTVAGTSYLNRTAVDRLPGFSEKAVVQRKSVILGKGGRENENRLFLFVRLPEGHKRLVVMRKFGESVSIGEEIELQLRRGFFGYPYVVGYKSAIS